MIDIPSAGIKPGLDAAALALGQLAYRCLYHHVLVVGLGDDEALRKARQEPCLAALDDEALRRQLAAVHAYADPRISPATGRWPCERCGHD
jgi:hypothetical protein